MHLPKYWIVLLIYCTVLVTKHFLFSTSTCVCHHCDTLILCHNAPCYAVMICCELILTLSLHCYCAWRVCRRYWDWTAIRNTLPTPRAGKYVPFLCDILFFFHSVHPSLLLALPLPLSSSFPPSNSPAIIHQTACQYSQGRGKGKKTRERRENIFRNF